MDVTQTHEHVAAGLNPTQKAGVMVFPLAVIKAMRPRQWTKNLLCAVALIMANRLANLTSDARMLATILLFCLLSGAVYLMNDSLDIERDRIHPTKRFRPIAAGEISLRAAQTFAVTIGALGLALALLLDTSLFAAALVYLLLQCGYVFYLKHVVLLDVFALALGYVIRAAAGALAIGVVISVWLYLCTMLGGLLLALGKRRQEIIELEDQARIHRPNLGRYSVALVDQLITIVAASTIVAYSLYTVTAANLPKNGMMMATVPFAIYGLFRYLYLMHQRGQGSSPEEVLLHDRPLQWCIILWVAVAIVVVSGSVPSGQ